MPAPSGTVWGGIVGNYGRIGIYAAVTANTETDVTVTYEVWFWSKYSVSDNSNMLYFNSLNTTGSATNAIKSYNIATTIDSGDGWSESNQIMIYTSVAKFPREKSAAKRYLYAKLENVDRVGGTMYAERTLTIPALASYNIAYSANGGSGAPSYHIKYYGIATTLSNVKPTRAGYTFQGWGTSASATTVAYAAGASYTANAAITLYAIWKANTYTVAYNANGGTGAPASQIKTHDTTLKLSTTTPSRTNYTFNGWGTSASDTTVAYAAGANYTENKAITLYAVWGLVYSKPRIFNLKASRCNSEGTEIEDGTYGLIGFEWECDKEVSEITVDWASIAGNGSKTITASGTSGTANTIIGNNGLNTETTYDITVTVSDSDGNTKARTTLSGVMFPMDFKAGGKGVSFGKPAEFGAEQSLGGNGVADFALDAKFNEPVYGKALGMDRLPAIPANSDLNEYMEPGCYAVYSNANAETVENIPVARAGRLEVWSSTGEGVRLEQWSYLRQRYIPYNSSNAVWERDITRGADNAWVPSAWWRSSLTPDASEKVYSKAAITASLNETKTLGIANAYTKIPLDNIVISTSGRLTLQDNSIRIGKNIQYVKVSGQALVGCGNTSGLRHVRIRKVSGETTTHISWVTCYGVANNQMIYPLTPVIASVKEGDLLYMVFYTSNSSDANSAGSAANGCQTYLTVEEL